MVARRRNGFGEGYRCGIYMRGEITASGETDRTTTVKGLLRFNGPDRVVIDEEHVATVIKDHGPDLGGKPQILDGFRQNEISSERIFNVAKDTR
jgi:hypothetical protein